jgi:hypothetical protein
MGERLGSDGARLSTLPNICLWWPHGCSAVCVQIILICAIPGLLNAILWLRRTAWLWLACGRLGSGSCGLIGSAKWR